ncbi:MAG: deoxyribonuclease IV [Candidatus Omnitrophota bacterium]
MLRLGAHVSISGHIYLSIERALKLRCNTMQIFSRNPRQIRRGFISEGDIKIFRQKLKESGIYSFIVHIPYTLNLAAPKKRFYAITIREFTEDLKEAGRLGADFLVTHPGSSKGLSKNKGLKRIIEALRLILHQARGVKTKILLENVSGSGDWLGSTFAELGEIIKGVSFNRKVGICLDTCHAFCAGYPLNTAGGLKEMIKEIDREVGVRRLKAIHLNDTNDDLGSKKDRHSHIGKGKIGLEGFSRIINHPLFRNIPFIIETPKESEEDDLNNLTTIRKLYANSG